MLLLDSQVLLWVLDDSRRLGRKARGLIGSADGVHISAATVWELTIKSMLGTLSVPADMSTRLVEQGFLPLSVTAEHAAASGTSRSSLGTIRSIDYWWLRLIAWACGW